MAPRAAALYGERTRHAMLEALDRFDAERLNLIAARAWAEAEADAAVRQVQKTRVRMVRVLS